MAILLCDGCAKEPAKIHGSVGNGNTGTYTENLVITPFEELNSGAGLINSHEDEWELSTLKMDKRSYIELGAENNVNLPTYSRITQLKDGSYILTWQNAVGTNGNGQDTFYSLSEDLKTWKYMGYLWQSYSVTNAKGNKDTRRFTNANTIQLSNGEIMAIAAFSTVNTYGTSETVAAYRPEQGMIIKRSKDGGLTWFGEKEIYHGPCWEAHMIELPSGEIQCFFSESRPSVSGSHSGTVMVHSKDGGNTWAPELGGNAYRVMRKHWMDVSSANCSKQITLAPGQMVQYDRTSGEVDLKYFSPLRYRGFHENRALHFYNLTLSDIATDLERYFGTKVVLMDEAIADKRYFALFTNNETLEQILMGINVDGSMKFYKKDGVIYITKK